MRELRRGPAAVRAALQKPLDSARTDALEKRVLGWRADARNLSAMVDEQLKHCRALRCLVSHLLSLGLRLTSSLFLYLTA